MRLDECEDVGFELCSGSMDAALQLLAREFGEPALHLVDPGSRCRREMNVPVRTARQPCLDPRGLIPMFAVDDSRVGVPLRQPT